MGFFSSVGSIGGSFFGPVGAGIGGAVGGAIDGRLGEKREDSVRDSEYVRQKEFAQMGIRWKVADAKAVGLHPLAAIGASTGQYAPGFAVGSQDTGPNELATRAALDRTRTAEERALGDLQRQALEAQISKDYAQAQMYHSEAARTDQQRLSSNPMSSGVNGVQIQPIQATHIIGKNLDPVPSGLIQGKAHEVTSSRPGDPSLAAGRNPGFADHILDIGPDGRPLVISAPMNEEGWSEGLESAGLHALPIIIRKSAAASGLTPKEWLWQYLTGNPPLPKRDRTPRPPPPVPRYRGGSRSVYGPVN